VTNSTTAAQPLDLGRYDIDCDGLPFKDKDGPWVAYDDVVALIAQARAARPESATGTTGASVKTWQERMAEQRFAYPERDHMLAEIADRRNEVTNLRAQLAARGQGEPVAWLWYEPASEWNGYEGRQRVSLEKPKASAAVNGCQALYLSAPASAQPDRGAVQDGYKLVPITINDSIRRVIQDINSDTGEGWKAEDEEGYWADLLKAAAVAPSDANGKAENLAGRIVSVDVSTGDDDYGNRIFAELTGETGSDGTTLLAIEKGRNFSDATGKADAANASGLSFRERFADAYLSLSVAHFNSPFWNQSMEELLAAVDAEINKRVAEKSPAASVADAKDAALRERVARTICEACEENPGHAGDARGNQFRWQDYLDIADKAIAAMAAAPSSAAGKEGGAS
jgi:hypothetical protein